MAFLKFMMKSAFRNKKRSGLAVLSAGFSLFLLFSLQSFKESLLNPPRAEQGDLRLTVSPTTSIMDSLPIAHMARIDKLPEVVAVTPFALVASYWKDDPHHLIRTMGVAPERFWRVFPDIEVTEAVREEFNKTKTGAIVGRELIDEFGWKVGDTMTFKGSMQPVDMELRIVGQYDWRFRSNLVFFHADYLSDLLGGYNRTSLYFVLGSSPEALPRIADAIDAEFRNSGAETRTQTERAFVVDMMSRVGNITLLMGSIGAVVVFTMLIVTASNMALSMRERTREIGILKALGYPWHVVLALLLGEAAMLSALSCLIACALSYTLLFVPFNKMTDGMISSFAISPKILGGTMIAGMALGILSALYPTIRASRIPVLRAIKPMD